MAMRMVARRLLNPNGEALLARSVVRREMSSTGKMFQEEERAAETIYIKVGRDFSVLILTVYLHLCRFLSSWI